MWYILLIVTLLFNFSCVTRESKVVKSSLTDTIFLYFKPGTLDLEDQKELLKVKDWILADRTAVRIEGYYCDKDIDNAFDETYLLEVCEKRALIVADKLIEAGISPSDISIIAFGKNRRTGRCKVKITKLPKK